MREGRECQQVQASAEKSYLPGCMVDLLLCFRVTVIPMRIWTLFASKSLSPSMWLVDGRFSASSCDSRQLEFNGLYLVCICCLLSLALINLKVRRFCSVLSLAVRAMAQSLGLINKELQRRDLNSLIVLAL